MREMIKVEWKTHRGFWLATFGCMVSLYTGIALVYIYASSVIGG